MFYGFHTEAVQLPGFRIEHVLKDIQELNTLARSGGLEVTAVSAAAYPMVAEKYFIMNVGSSVGRGYGPIVVSPQPRKAGALLGRRLAVPGLETTAYFLARIYLPEFTPVVVPFDQVMPAVKEGRADFALVIHDGQLTYKASGFHKVIDLGEAWEHETGLPIPLGLDLVRRDLGRETSEKVCAALKASIEYGLAHPEGADEYARTFGRGLDLSTSAQFVRMYVNEDTLDLGHEGRAALELLWNRAAALGLTPSMASVDVVGAGD